MNRSARPHHEERPDISILLHTIIDNDMSDTALRELLRQWDFPATTLRGDRTA